MKTTLLTTVAIIAMTAATSVVAEGLAIPASPVLSGEVSLDFAETKNNNYGGTMGLDLGVNVDGLATVDLDMSATDGTSLTLDNWTVGTTVGALAVAFGDDNNLMPESGANAATQGTLATPAMTESLQVTTGSVSVALGFTDWTADVTDISNVQGAYTMGVAGLDVTASADYNLDSENTVFGGEVSGVDLGMVALGGAVSYDMDAEVFGFESNATAGSLTAYLNGDDTNTLQNIGGEYAVGLGASTLTSGINYDVDAEDITPTVSLSFNF
jgi:hypothetical protein|tara:strand:- start:229 stop:1038 length:810 start_codon:yes stop_codon:yes gene_type:complete